MIYFNDHIVEKHVGLTVSSPETPIKFDFNFNSVKIINLKRLFDFVAEKSKKDIVFDEVLNDIVNADGCYELPSWMTKSGHPECIYFERDDKIDEETFDVLETVIEF